MDDERARRPAAEEGRHDAVAAEEWTFTFWSPDGASGGVVLLRHDRVGKRTGYWSALVRAGAPLLHVSDWDAPLPAAGLSVRSPGLWADHTCEAPFEQWTVVNETYAVALDDPADVLDRAYGTAAPLALDLEWYAAGPAGDLTDGYEQAGEVHGVVELGEGPLALDGVPAHRTHRWGVVLGPPAFPLALAHLGPRAPVRLPGGDVLDLVLTSDGWRQREPR